MTDPERTVLAESLLAVIFSMRTDNAEAGQAWVLSIATTAIARAVLVSVGPQGDAESMLAFAVDQARSQIAAAQAKFFRDRLTGVNGGKSS